MKGLESTREECKECKKKSNPPFGAVQPAAPLPPLRPAGVPGVLGAQDGGRGRRGGGGARLRPVLRLLPLRVSTQLDKVHNFDKGPATNILCYSTLYIYIDDICRLYIDRKYIYIYIYIYMMRFFVMFMYFFIII